MITSTKETEQNKMKMQIALYNMISGGITWADVNSFINRGSIGWLTYCLESKWCWDVTDIDGFISDGPCIFIRWV